MIALRLGPWLLATLVVACNDTPGVLTDTGTPATTGTTGTTTGEPGHDGTTGTGSTTSADTTAGSSSTSVGSTEESGTTGTPIEDMGCPECIVLADGLEGGRGLTLDDGYVYWTDQVGGRVERAPKGGGEREVLADNQIDPYGVGVNDEYVYWTSFTEMGTVQRRPLAGGTIIPLAADAFPRFLQVVGDWVYWCSFDDVLGRVRRVPTTGVGEPPQTLVSVGSGVADLVVTGDVVHFTAHLPPAGPGLAPEGLVYEASALVPTEEVDLVTVASNQAEPWGITRYQGWLYWINGIGNPQDLPRRVLSIPLLGGVTDPTTLAVQQTSPWGIAVDEQYVYWTDYIEVKAIPRAGGDTIQLADLQNVARSILVDEDSVYWITKTRVLQRPKP